MNWCKETLCGKRVLTCTTDGHPARLALILMVYWKRHFLHHLSGAKLYDMQYILLGLLKLIPHKGWMNTDIEKAHLLYKNYICILTGFNVIQLIISAFVICVTSYNRRSVARCCRKAKLDSCVTTNDHYLWRSSFFRAHRKRHTWHNGSCPASTSSQRVYWKSYAS